MFGTPVGQFLASLGMALLGFFANVVFTSIKKRGERNEEQLEDKIKEVAQLQQNIGSLNDDIDELKKTITDLYNKFNHIVDKQHQSEIKTMEYLLKMYNRLHE